MESTLRDVLKRRQPHSLIVLGSSDTGKTTLIEQCLAEWEEREPPAVVDCDVGQSHLGPPTTVGWGVMHPPFSGWRGVTLQGMVFIGGVSPEGHVETFLDAVQRMVEAARRHAACVVIDTTGLVNGELGQTLKRRKVERLLPDLIVAVQREGELEELLKTLPPIPVERLAASAACARRSLAQRAAYRDARFARYFASSVMHRVSLGDVSPAPVNTGGVRLTGLGPDWPTGKVMVSPAALMDRVVGLRNAHGEDRALGLVRDVDQEHRRVVMLSPLRDLSGMTTLVVGSIRWPQSTDAD